MPAVYHFGQFSIDTAGYRLMQRDKPIALSPKALDLLIMFADRPSALLTKDEILTNLWRDVAVTDNALTQVISELRHALGDDPSSPSFIQTVPRRGYRFVAEVTISAEDKSTPHLFGGLQPRVNVRETASVEAYRAFTDGRLKLELLDPTQVDSSIADFERALELDPKYALAHVALAHAHFWTFQASRVRNRPDVEALVRAVSHARRAIELDADLAEAHSALALFLAGADRPVEAAAAGRRALALEPGNWRHEFRLGIAAWGAERIACLEAVLLQFPQFAYAYFGIAMVYVARRDLSRAEDVLRRALGQQQGSLAKLERFPGRGLHWLLGMICLAGGDTERAGQGFAAELASTGPALLAEEFSIDSLNGIGFTRLAENRPAEALDSFQQALDRYPDQPRAVLGSAVALRQVGRESHAIEALAQADRAIDTLRSQRPAEGTILRAIRQTITGDTNGAIAELGQLLESLPAGSAAGWGIPIEPLFVSLAATPAFAPVLEKLAERAR
jgi:DNA-binding winged helix-turn-helix (wHTH) protein/Tfp pilus assembly protein PilF